LSRAGHTSPSAPTSRTGSAGGPAVTRARNRGELGIGTNPNKDPLIGGFTLSRQDRDDLIEFLKSLTDDMVVHDPRFANPWPLTN